MNLREAAEVLDVKLAGLTQETVDDNFRRVVKLWHPDGGVVGIDHAGMLDKAKKARNLLRAFVGKGGLPPPCSACGGTGQIRGTVGIRTCRSCNGGG